MVMTDEVLRRHIIATYPIYDYLVTGHDEQGIALIDPGNNLLSISWPDAYSHMVDLLAGKTLRANAGEPVGECNATPDA